MADEELQEYPSGQLSISPGGRMRQVTSVNIKESNGRRLTHSLAATPAGYINGVKDVSGSFSMEIPKKGIERGEFIDVQTAKQKQARLEIPGNAIVIQMVITEVDIKIGTGESVKVDFNYIGKKTAVTKIPVT